MMKITLAVVARNEEACLPSLLDDIRAQTYPHEEIEILLVDSGSSDRTPELMEAFREEGGFLRIKISPNPGLIQSAGWNVAIREFLSGGAEALVRVDAHARIPADFIASCVEALGEGEKAEMVVGGVRTTLCRSDDAWSRTLWMAEESMFGSGISTARHDSTGDYVKSLFHACYRRDVLAEVGGFREDLGRTEDNEFHYRIRQKGYRIFRSPKIHSQQYIRPTLDRMLRQKAGNGFWVGRTLGIVPGCISPYHLVPFVFVAALVTSVILAFFGHPWCLQLGLALYASVAILMTIAASFSLQRAGERIPGTAWFLPLLFFCLHVSYGLGTFIGLCSIIQYIFNRKSRSGLGL